MAAAPAKQEVSYVQYFIPSDGDTEEHPNVFVVRQPPKSLCLSHLTSSFPLPGEYLFRAKIPFGKTHVWLDLSSPDEAVPTFNTKFVLKVSRVSMGAAGQVGGAGAAAAAARPAAISVAAASSPTLSTAGGTPNSSSSGYSSSNSLSGGGGGGAGAGAAAAAAAATAAAAPAPAPRPVQQRVVEPVQEAHTEDLLGVLGGGSSAAARAAPSTGPQLDLLGNPLGGGGSSSSSSAGKGAASTGAPAAFVDPFAPQPTAARGAQPPPPKKPTSVFEENIFNM